MKWFISDLHLDHANVLVGLRGEAFSTIEGWQEHMLDAINTCVQNRDHLYLLGDFLGHDRGGARELVRWRRKIRQGQLWLIQGNHDASATACSAAFGRQFRQVMEVKVCGVKTWLSHYAHAFWPGSHRGHYHLYGHNHGQREATLDAWMPERRSMEVCPEVIYQLTGQWRPINEEEVHAVLSQRAGHDPLSFYTQNR